MLQVTKEKGPSITVVPQKYFGGTVVVASCEGGVIFLRNYGLKSNANIGFRVYGENVSEGLVDMSMKGVFENLWTIDDA